MERIFIVRKVYREWFYVTLGMGGPSILAGIVGKYIIYYVLVETGRSPNIPFVTGSQHLGKDIQLTELHA